MSEPVSSVELARSFRRGFAATLALDLVTKALGVVAVVVLIRGLSVSSFAYITLFLAFAQFAGSAAGGGVRTRYLREEAERVSRAGGEAAEGPFADPLLKGTLLVLGIGMCAASVAWATGFVTTFGRGTTLILYATGFATAHCAVELAIAHHQARRRFFVAGALSVLRATALLGASVAIVFSRQSTLVISVWLIASMAAAAVIAAGPIARRSLLARTRFPRVSWLNREEMWLSLYYLGSAGFAYVDVMVVAALLGENEVATLGASLRYLAIVLAGIPALGAVLRVRTSQFDLVDAPANQRALVLRWIRRATLPTALLVGTAVLLAPFMIPQIDGGRYPESVEVLQIFLATALAAYVLAPGPSMLMAQRRYAVLASIYALGLSLNLVGDIAVARTFGVVGIAIVSSIVYIAIDIAMVVWSLAVASRTKA